MMQSMDDDDVSLHSLELSLVSPLHDRQDDSPAILSRKEQIATANNFLRNSVQTATKNIQVNVTPSKVHYSSRRARGLDPPLPLLDPPEEYKPTAMMESRLRHRPRRNQGSERKSSPRPSSQLSCNDYGHNPSIASRDDDSAIRSLISVHSSGASTGRASISSHRSHGTTRQDIHTKIEALNAKRRALRKIICSSSSSSDNNNDKNLAKSSGYNSEPLTLSLQSPSLSALTWSSPLSPASVISIPPTSVSVEHKRDHSFPSENIDAAVPDTPAAWSMLPCKPSHKATDESVDSRSFMKERLELQQRTQQTSVRVGGGAPLSNNKKVTFEEDFRKVANIGMDESSSSVGEKNLGVVVKDSFRGPPSASDTNENSAAFATARNNGTDTSLPCLPGGNDTDSHPAKQLLKKILSENILKAYTMTHSHCPNFDMTLILGGEQSASSTTPSLPIRSISNNLPVLPQVSSSSSTAKTTAVSATSKKRRLMIEGPTSTPETLDPVKRASTPSPDPVVGTHSRVPEGKSVDGFAKSLSQTPSFASQPSDLIKRPSILSKSPLIETQPSVMPNSRHQHLNENSSSRITRGPSTKSNKNHPVDAENIKDLLKDDLVLLQDQIQAVLAKVKKSQESLEREISGYQPMEKFKSARSPNLDKDIANTPSIKSGDSPPHPLAVAEQVKVNDQRNATVNNSLIVSSDDNPPNLTSLQDQLGFEITTARKSQSMLENSLRHTNSNTSIASTKSKGEFKIESDETETRITTSTKSQKDLRIKLEKTEKSQFALERIIEDAATTKDAQPPILLDGNADDVLPPTIPQMTLSYSISQQEVDATGNLKEYIPSPSYLNFGANIPSVVVVYHIPEEGDPSVAAQSHHLNNLKRSERYHRRVNSSIFDCCGNSTVNKRPNHRRDSDTGYDFDTIGTDDEYTVDCTLNTMDDSRLDHLPLGHEEHGYKVNGETIEIRRDTTEIDSCIMPQSSLGNLLVSLFGCSNGQGDDAYSRASRRGIAVGRHRQWQPYYYDKAIDPLGKLLVSLFGCSNCQGDDTYSRASQRGIAVGQHRQCQPYYYDKAIDRKQPTMQHQSPSSRQFCEDPEEHHKLNLSLGKGSYFGSICRNGGNFIPGPQNRHSSRCGTWGINYHDSYIIKDSTRCGGHLIPKEQFDHRCGHSPPPKAADWGRINNSQNEGTDFESMRRVGSHRNQQAQTYSSRPKSSPQNPRVNARPHPMPISHPRRYLADCSSVQSDLTDYSSSIKPRAAFLSSRRGRKSMLQHQHPVMAFVEEEGQSAENVGVSGGRYSPVQKINPLA